MNIPTVIQLRQAVALIRQRNHIDRKLARILTVSSTAAPASDGAAKSGVRRRQNSGSAWTPERRRKFKTTMAKKRRAPQG